MCACVYHLCHRWYTDHLKTSQKPETYVLLLTNDMENRNLARQDGLEAYSGKQLVGKTRQVLSFL